MKSLKICKIREDYINYLLKKESRVPHNKNQRRPYVGIVLLVSGYSYFVPMESPKPNHANIKPGMHIMKLEKGSLGLLGFNNMIPVHDSAIIDFDIDAVADASYAELLRRQITFINRHKSDVLDHANRTYYAQVNGKNKFMHKICCDFKLLERMCSKYDPSFKLKKDKR